MVDVQVVAPTGEPGTIPEENLKEALAAGFTQAGAGTAAALPAVQAGIKPEDIGPAGTYNVVAPDGQHGTVPTDALPSALKNGFVLKSVHAKEADYKGRVGRYERDLKDGLTGGHIETGLRGYADEFLAGGANKLEKWLGQSEEEAADPEVQLENKAYAEAQENVNQEQSGTYGAGEVAGFLGQTYLGSKLAGGAAPGIASGLAKAGVTNPLVEAAAKEAIAGGITMSPQALAQAAIDKDPQAAAESLLWGIGTGAVLGGALKLGSEYFAGQAAKGVAQKAALPAGPLVDTELNTTEKLLLEHLGLTRAMKRNIGDATDQRRILTVLAKEFGNDDLEEGTRVLSNTNKEDLAMKVKKLTDDNGPKIGQIRTDLDAAIAKDPAMMIGQNQIGDVPSLALLNAANEVAALKASLISPEEEKVVDHANKFLVDKFGNGRLPFSDIDKIKSYFQDRVDWTAKGAEKAPNRVAAKVAAIVRTHVEDAAAEIATASQSKKIIEDWTNYKALYGVGKTLDLAADNILNTPITHEFIPGGHGTLGAGVLGHMAGSAIGLPVIGPIAGIMGAKMVKHYLRDGGIAKAAYWLGGRIKDPAIHSYIAVDAMRAMSQQLDNIPREVKSFAEAGATRALTKKDREPISNSISTALGEDATGLSKQKQFEKLAEKLSFAKSNPQANQQNIQDIVEGVAQEHPQLAQDLSMAMQKKLEYLYTILPKNPNTPMPFQHDRGWKPSAAELHDFQKQLAIANDPFHAIEELKNGTITAQQVAALAVINPDLLNKMRGELIKMSQDKKVDLGLQKRLTMGIMLGQSIDASLEATPLLQAALSGAQQAPGPNTKPAKVSKKPNIQEKGLPDYRTSFQKSLSNSGSK